MLNNKAEQILKDGVPSTKAFECEPVIKLNEVNQDQKEVQPESVLDRLDKLRLSRNPAAKYPVGAIKVKGVDAFHYSNLWLVSGAVKSRKTGFIVGCAVCVATGEPMLGYLTPTKKGRVLIFDTEQGQDWGLLTYESAFLSTLHDSELKENLHYYDLRTESPASRIEMIKAAIEEFEPKLIIIDGIIDLNPAAEMESTAAVLLVQELLQLVDKKETALICVLHSKRSIEGGSMRGHIGGECERKCSGVAYLKQDDKMTGKPTEVEFIKTRGLAPESFYFTYQNRSDIFKVPCTYIPELSDKPKEPTQEEIAYNAICEPDFLKKTANGMSPANLKTLIKDYCGVGVSNAERAISRAMANKILICKPKDGSKKQNLYYPAPQETEQALDF